MTSHPPTAEQAHIHDLFLTGQDLRIRAGAGTGKTTTLTQLADILTKQDRLGLYIAFNKSISTEAQRKFPHHVTCLTSHSLAYRGIRDTRHAPLLKKMRATTRVPISSTQANLGILSADITGYDGHIRQLSAYQITRHTLRTIGEFCKTANETLGPQHIPTMPGLGDSGHLQLVDIVLPYAQRGWADLTDPNRNALTFGHDHYVKLWALEHPRIGRDGDALFLDEAQDTNPVLAGIIAEQEHLQRIVVGDSAQAIYRFTGATSFMTDDSIPNSIEARLTQSWRFGQAIADEANHLLTRLGDDMRLTGNPEINSRIDRTLTTADAILTRSNGRALEHVMASQRAGRKVHLMGEQHHSIKFCNGAEQLQNGKNANIEELAAFSSWRQVVQYTEDSPDAADWKVLVKLIETHGAPALRRALERTTDENHADLIVTTAHKAKGREWSRVFLDDDLTIAVENAAEGNDSAALRDELMLGYVAVTRAQHVLNPGRRTQTPIPASQIPTPRGATEQSSNPEKLVSSDRFLDALDRMENIGTLDEIIVSVIERAQLRDSDAIREQLADEIGVLDDDPRITWARFDELWVAAGGRKPVNRKRRQAQLDALATLRQTLPPHAGTRHLAQSTAETALCHLSTRRLTQLWEEFTPEHVAPQASQGRTTPTTETTTTTSYESDRVIFDNPAVTVEAPTPVNDPARMRPQHPGTPPRTKSNAPADTTAEQKAWADRFPKHPEDSGPSNDDVRAKRYPRFVIDPNSDRVNQRQNDPADPTSSFDDAVPDNDSRHRRVADGIVRAGAAIARRTPVVAIRAKWKSRSHKS